jgi:hypothetical protein
MQPTEHPKPRRRVVEAAPIYAERRAVRYVRAEENRLLKAGILERLLHAKHGDGENLRTS